MLETSSTLQGLSLFQNTLNKYYIVRCKQEEMLTIESS